MRLVIVLDTTDTTYTFYKKIEKSKETKEDESEENKKRKSVVPTRRRCGRQHKKQAKKETKPSHGNAVRLQTQGKEQAKPCPGEIAWHKSDQPVWDCSPIVGANYL